MERFGLVGLPNAGKSSLYNALTGGRALAAPYAFATKDPNVGVSKVIDSRLDQLADRALIPGHDLGYGQAGQLRLAQPQGVQRGQQDVPASVRGCAPALGFGASNTDLCHRHLRYHAYDTPSEQLGTTCLKAQI